MRRNNSRQYRRRARVAIDWSLGILQTWNWNSGLSETLTTMNNCSCFKGLSFKIGNIYCKFHRTLYDANWICKLMFIMVIFGFHFSSVFSNLPHSSKRAKLSWYSLKVTLATLEKGKVKDPSRQVYILITDETANVPHIKVKCQEELGISNIKLVSANGLPFEDSDGTKGRLHLYDMLL